MAKQPSSNGAGKIRRPIEREYLATLNEAVPLGSWKSICEKAADDALAGDARARDWLAKWLLGIESRLLTTLAAQESVAAPEAAIPGELIFGSVLRCSYRELLLDLENA